MLQRIGLLIYGLFILSYSAFTQSQSTWKTSSPEEQGMSSLVFANAIKNFKKDNANIHSLLVIKNNHVVLDVSFYPFQNSYAHDLASVTKSIVSLLIGIAIDKKFIMSEDEPIIKYFPELRIDNDTLQTITIKSLLNMSSGFQCSWNDGEKELNEMRSSKDWVKFILTLPFTNNPDSRFSYCSGNFYLLSEILQRSLKMTSHEFAEKYLFKPLSFGKSYWVKTSNGVNIGWGDLHLSTYDFAKIGSLVLNDGIWNGKQVISSQWIEKIKPLHKIHNSEYYGYGWWLDSTNPDEIQAAGRGGQRLFIFKNRNMVIATTGGGAYDVGNIDDLALQAISSYNKNENHHTLLQFEIKNASSPDTSIKTAGGFPEYASNKHFFLANNKMGLRSIGFEKSKSGYIIGLSFIDSSKEQHPVGMNNQYLLSKEHSFGLPTAVKGRWINNTLNIDYNRLCRIENYKFSISFLGDSLIQLAVTEDSKGISETIAGKTFTNYK
jgi:CubicO group peptidase (beta-lactamase class C family)